MNGKPLLAVTAMTATIVVPLLLFTASVTGNWLIFGIPVLLILALVLAALVDRYVWVRVPEMEVQVVFHRERKAFVRFLPAGRQFLLPTEYVNGRISTMVRGVTVRCEKVQTTEGIDVTLAASVAVAFDPLKITPGLQSRFARVLPEKGEGLVRNHAGNVLTHLVNEYTVQALLNDGSRRRMEQQLLERIKERLAPFGIDVYRVMLKGVELPAAVRQAHQDVHQRVLHAKSEAEALEQLHFVISRFSPEDREMLVTLRQIYEMGRNGVALHLPWPMLSGSGNGRLPAQPSGEQPQAPAPDGPTNGAPRSPGITREPPEDRPSGYGDWVKS